RTVATPPIPRFAESFFVPAGRAFFDKCLHPFERGFVHHVARHSLTRRFVSGCDTELGLTVEKFFSHCDCNTWFTDDGDDEFLELRVELVGFCDAVDQAARFCLLRADEFSRHEHLESLLTQNISRERHAGCGAEQADVYPA